MAHEDLKKTVGSLLVVGFEGHRVTDSLENFLKQWELGGVILFKRNIESFDQVRELNLEIDRLATAAPIVSVDHEGGRVFRLPDPFTTFPPMRAVGEACLREGTGQAAEEVGKIFARELRAAGFNLDYAPVLDVDSESANPIIGDRAFSSDPEAAADAALSFWKGLEAEGVRGCGKHFPGHGATKEDSHLTLPVIDKPEKELVLCEWVPFVKAIRAGIPLIMTAHVLYSALDKEWPATLSEKILQGLLRKRMGYQGLIISDDFFMEGIAAKWGMEEAVERFLRAGGDLVLLCHQEAVQRRVAAHLVHQAEKDSDFRVLLEERAKKMAKFRKKLARGIGASGLVLPAEAHQVAARRFLPA